MSKKKPAKAEKKADTGPAQPASVGRIVHFVVESDSAKKKNQERPEIVHRPAIVIHAYDGEEAGKVDLEVFLRGRHDGPQQRFIEGAPYDADAKIGTWHWPEYVAASAADPVVGGKGKAKAGEVGTPEPVVDESEVSREPDAV